MSNHLTHEAQIHSAIEYAALAYEYLLRPRLEGTPKPRSRRLRATPRIDASKAKPHNGSWNTTRLAEFVRELQGQTESRETGSAERILRKYLRFLPEVVPEIEANLQGGYITGYNRPQSQVRLASYYLRVFMADNVANDLPCDQNDAALTTYVYAVGAMHKPNGRSDASKALLQLVIIRHAIRYQLALRIGVLGKSSEHPVFTEILPAALYCEGTNLNLVVREKSKQEYSLIELNRITTIETDLHRAFLNRSESAERNFSQIRGMVRSNMNRVVCEIPITRIPDCLSSLAGLANLDFSDSETARITIQGSTESVNSALLSVLPYARFIAPGPCLERVRAHISELGLAMDRIQ